MRHAVKAFGVALMAAISMMAVTAAAAHATEGKIRVAGKVLTGTEMFTAEGTGGAGELFVPGLSLKISCTGSELNGEGGNLNSKGELLLHAHGLINATFTGCAVVGNKVCKIYPTEADMNAKTNAGKINAHALALWLARLAGGVDHVQLTEDPNFNSFATWYYTSSEEGCTLALETKVTGIGAAAVPNATTEATEHELNDITKAEEETLKKTMTLGLFYGTEPSEIIGGNVKGHLTGALVGKEFSVE